MVENMQEVIDYMTTNAGNEEVKSYVGGLNPMTSDRANTFFDTDEGKRFMQPKLDSYATKGIESFKTNNLDKIYSERFAKENPAADPRDIQLNEMKAMMDKMQKDSTRKELQNSALKTAQDKGIDSNLIDFFIADTAEATNSNLDKFIASMAKHDEKIKLDFAKGTSHTPAQDTKAAMGTSEKDKILAEMKKNMK